MSSLLDQVKRTGIGRYRTEIILGIALVLLTISALGPVCTCDFVDFDDDVYVTKNLSVLEGLTPESIWWSFTATRSNHWHPLTWLSLQWDVELFGSRHPQGFHLTNLLLHIGNVLLLFTVLRQMTGLAWRSSIVAAFFAVHPLHVESVAWVTERKDVLSTFFWLLTTIVYVRYARKPGWRPYALAFVFFILGLLSKPMLVTLPLTFLLLDYWPLRRFAVDTKIFEKNESPVFTPARFSYLVFEKLPFFLVGIASVVISLIARQSGGGLKSGIYLSLDERLGYAICAPIGYLIKTFWPIDLIPFYPLTHGGPPFERVAASATVLVVLTLVSLAVPCRHAYLSVGWLWFLVTLVPVSGVIQLGSYALADRYTYVPLIGVFIGIVWGMADLVSHVTYARGPAIVTTVLLILAAALVSRQQVGYWHDSIALWEHTCAVTPDNYFARKHLGWCYVESQRYDEAETEFLTAVRLEPGMAEAYGNLGRFYQMRDKPKDAEAYARKAVELQPREARYHNDLGHLLQKLGQTEAAEEEFQAARGQKIGK